jgi:hypothetical protein
MGKHPRRWLRERIPLWRLWWALEEQLSVFEVPSDDRSNTSEANMTKLASAAALLLAVSSGAFAQAPENPPQPIPEATQPKPPASPETIQPVTPGPEASKPMTPAGNVLGLTR